MADLSEANLSRADLTGANLTRAILTEANVNQAILANCKVYGLSTWNLIGVPEDQSSFVITSEDEAEIAVDDVQVAQFIYLLLKNRNVRAVVDTITCTSSGLI